MADRRQPHGWLILDKPRGLGSTQAVGAVKRNLREAGYGKVKVGHGGTLDPLAEGLLPIALGEATKLAGRMLDASKMYDFTLTFGVETDTLDAEGVEIRSAALPVASRVWQAIHEHKGALSQVPPAYSAIKVDGRRSYDLARKGQEVALKPRKIMVYNLISTNRLDNRFDQEPIEEARLRAEVSKGTYIRSLAHDIAVSAGSVGHITYLRRIRVGAFNSLHAISLDMLNEIGKGAPLQDHLLPLEAGLDDIPAFALDPTSAQAVRQGREVSGLPQADGLHFAKLGDVPVALMEIAGGTAKVVRGFNLT